MRKMKLHLDDLAVETFEVIARDAAGVGTVHARADGAVATEPPKEPDSVWTCPAVPGGCTCIPEWYTCGESCPNGTCAAVGCTFDETGCGTCASACPATCTLGQPICWPGAVTTACMAGGVVGG